MKNKIKVDICAYTSSNNKLETTVWVNFNQDSSKVEKEAIELGKKFWHNYNKALIQHICVDYIHN